MLESHLHFVFVLGHPKIWFLSFYKEIMDAHFQFYIILSNYVWSILFYQIEDHNVRQIGFHVCVKMRCKRKKLSGQPNTL